jgi:hypothetical protein
MAWVQVGIVKGGSCPDKAPWIINDPLDSVGVSVSTISKWITEKSKHRAHFGTCARVKAAAQFPVAIHLFAVSGLVHWVGGVQWTIMKVVDPTFHAQENTGQLT